MSHFFFFFLDFYICNFLNAFYVYSFFFFEIPLTSVLNGNIGDNHVAVRLLLKATIFCRDCTNNSREINIKRLRIKNYNINKRNKKKNTTLNNNFWIKC
jgi:hypothetical protein